MKIHTKIALMTFATLTLLGGSIQKNVQAKAYGNLEATTILKDEISMLNADQVTYRTVNYYIPQLKEVLEKYGNYEGIYHTDSAIVGEPVELFFIPFDEVTWINWGYPPVGHFKGWYSDDTFTTPFKKGTLLEEGEDALKLYGLFDYSTDYTFYLDDSDSIFGNKPYIYFKRQFDDQEKAAWPGEALTKNENGYYEIPIDVSYGYDTIVINDGTSNQETAIQSVIFDANTVLDQDVLLVGTQNEDKTYNLIAPEYTTINYYDGENLLSSSKAKKSVEFKPAFYEKEGYRLIGWYLESTFETLYTGGTLVDDSLNLYAKYVETEDFELYIDFSMYKGLGINLTINEIAVHRWSSNFDNPYATDTNNLPNDVVKISDIFYKFTFDASKSFDQLQIKVNDKLSLTINYNQYMKGTFSVYPGSDDELRAMFLPEMIQAHIKNEGISLPIYYPMEGGNMDASIGATSKEAAAPTTGVSRVTCEEGEIIFNTDGITEEQRKNAIITYFKDREAGYWCDKSANYLEYQILANGYENEIIDEAGTTIGDRVNYLTALAQKTNNNSQSARFNNASITNNNVSFVILVVALGFISIIGYYFFNKRKLEI